MYPFITHDIGNTQHKTRKWLEHNKFIDLETNIIEGEHRQIFCSVTSKKVEKAFNVISLFKNSKFLEMPVHYEKSIGIDRLVSSFYLFDQKKYPSILIDAGTFTKVEYITRNGFMGGYILPGVELLKQCYQRGENLKDFKISLHQVSDLPSASSAAISHGFSLSVLEPIKAILNSLEFENIYLTGGNAESIFKYLQTIDCQGASIHLEPGLIHIGLALIATKVLK